MLKVTSIKNVNIYDKTGNAKSYNLLKASENANKILYVEEQAMIDFTINYFGNDINYA